MKRYLLFAVVTVVALAADQATKLWADSNLAPTCKLLGDTDAAAPQIARCHDQYFSVRLAAPASRLSLSDAGGVRWTATCADNAACLSGVVRLGKPPVGAITGGAPGLRFGRYSLTAQSSAAQSSAAQTPAATLRFAYEPGDVVSLVGGYLDFRYVENPGATWGFLADSPSLREPILLSIAVLASLFIVWMARRLEPGQRLVAMGLGLVLSGAIGNFIDRARLSYVIDFIDFHVREHFRWPTFNVADVAIVVGVGLLLLDALKSWRKERRERRERSTDAPAS